VPKDRVELSSPLYQSGVLAVVLRGRRLDDGASSRNRTDILSLEGWYITTLPWTRKMVDEVGLEPTVFLTSLFYRQLPSPLGHPSIVLSSLRVQEHASLLEKESSSRRRP
jgi:hypothetical protein